MISHPINGHAEGTYGSGWCGTCALNHHYWQFVTCNEFTYRGATYLDEAIRKALVPYKRVAKLKRFFAALKRALWELCN